MKLSVVIPAYNESEIIKSSIEELLSIADNISDIHKLQVIIVDDHSSDDTCDVVGRIGDPRVSCLRLSRRSGSQTAARAGISEADGDAVLCMAADGQDDPGCLKEMMAKWREGSQIVWALRRDRTKESARVRLPAQIFYRLFAWLTGNDKSHIDLSRADFYLLDRSVTNAIKSCPERNTSLFALISWVGFQQSGVVYERRERRAGFSKWNFRSRVLLAKDWIVAFSGFPLRLASSLGFFTALLGLIYAVYIIANKLLFNTAVQGWATIIVLMLFLGGIQLTILGIIGEYLWRTLDESRNRPLFFIEKRAGRHQDSLKVTRESEIERKDRSLV